MSKISNQFAAIIKAKIKKYTKTQKQEQHDEGYVVSVNDGIVIVSGLDNAMLNEIVKFENGSFGMVLNLEANCVGVVMLGNYTNIKENSRVIRTRQTVSVPVGDNLLGRIINALGFPQDGLSDIKYKIKMPIEKIAPNVMMRETVSRPLETGILSIDSMFPIGKGQRELIIGDRQTGKTTLAIDTIINQKGKNVKCIYVAIGQKESSVVQIYQTLKKAKAMEYTTIVNAPASDLPALIYIAPYTGTTIAEYWLNRGEDVLIVYDDLTKHAINYRTLSLLLRRPPGREAYPGDVFYLHSRLLERSCQLNKKNKGGSITALPIIETQIGDISAYIPTNVISITDGQLFMVTSMFNAGQRPAIDPGLSVSRVGSSAQRSYVKQTASTLKLDLARYNELRSFSQFGSDLDDETKQILNHGERIMALIKQAPNKPYEEIAEVLILFAIKNRIIDYIPLNLINNFKDEMLEYFIKQKNVKELSKKQTLDGKLTAALLKEMQQFTLKFIKKIPNYDSKQYGDIAKLK